MIECPIYLGRRTILTDWPDDFEELYKQRGQHKYGIRLLALWKIQNGMSQTELSQLIGKTHKTIRLWRETYESKGLDELLQIKEGRGRPPRISEKTLIDEAIKKLTIDNTGGRIRGQDLVDYFASKHDIHYSLSGMYHRLHKLKYSWITSRSKHPKKTSEAIEEFKKKFPTLARETIPDHISMNSVDVWFQDESRVGQQGSQTRIWAPTGTRPRVVKQQQFLNSYIFGAVCPRQKTCAAIVVPLVNHQALEEHLKELSTQVPQGRHALVLMDRAGWHCAKGLTIPKNVSLLHLPPYSPELNPQEQVWQYLKDRYLSNRVFKNLEEITDACCSAWNEFASETERIASLTQRKWAQF